MENILYYIITALVILTIFFIAEKFKITNSKKKEVYDILDVLLSTLIALIPDDKKTDLVLKEIKKIIIELNKLDLDKIDDDVINKNSDIIINFIKNEMNIEFSAKEIKVLKRIVVSILELKFKQ